MTRWIALVLRLCALYLAWLAANDVCSALAALELTGSFGSSPQVRDGLRRSIASMAYEWSALAFILHVVGAVILWVKCLRFARIITADLDPQEPSR